MYNGVRGNAATDGRGAGKSAKEGAWMIAIRPPAGPAGASHSVSPTRANGRYSSAREVPPRELLLRRLDNYRRTLALFPPDRHDGQIALRAGLIESELAQMGNGNLT